MEHNKQFVGIENAARIPGTDYTTQMQIRAMTKPGKKKKDKSPLLKILAKLGLVEGPATDNLEREDEHT